MSEELPLSEVEAQSRLDTERLIEGQVRAGAAASLLLGTAFPPDLVVEVQLIRRRLHEIEDELIRRLFPMREGG